MVVCLLDVRNQGFGAQQTPPKHILQKRQGTLRMAMVLGVPQLGTGEPASARVPGGVVWPEKKSHGASNQMKKGPYK